MNAFLLRSLAAVIAPMLLQACLWAPLLHRAPISDEIVHAETEDGWRIAMHHYRPAPGTSAHGTPVVVSHGISANERTWSLDEEKSFPRYLAERGWDVWAIDLRGVGHSDTPSLFNDKSWNYDFDDYVTRDVPAVIDEVLRRTGAPRVHWVGHSMGGMIMYGYVSRYGDAKLKTVTTVGSPVRFTGYAGYLAWAQEMAPAFRDYLFTVPERAFIPGIAVFGGAFRTRAEYLVWNYDNLSPESARLIMYNGTANMAGGVLRSLAGPFTGAPFASRDGAIDYLAGLSRLTVPLHVVGGIADNLGTIAAITPAFDAAASTDKRLRIFARANGDSHDYGHVDLTVGDNAPREVYPELETWLRSHE